MDGNARKYIDKVKLYANIDVVWEPFPHLKCEKFIVRNRYGLS